MPYLLFCKKSAWIRSAAYSLFSFLYCVIKILTRENIT